MLREILLHGKRDLDRAVAIVSPADFFNPGTRAVYEAMIALDAMGAPPEIGLVRSWMRVHGTLDAIGGPAGLGSLIE